MMIIILLLVRHPRGLTRRPILQVEPNVMAV